MKKLLIGCLTVASIACLCTAVGCKDKEKLPAVVLNGGFETADLSGWTVEYGDAYDNDSVSSKKTFSYSADIDPQGYVIPVNQTGNWYLSGKGFDGKRPSTCTGAIRSDNFVLSGDGFISMKLAGGSSATARSDTAEQKPASEVCYVGVYRASDDKMLAYQTNRYFAEDASNIDIADYENGTCYTDNFCKYTIDLSGYIGEELYIRIVDNDTGYYYGYLSVDDIRIGKDAQAQAEGAYFAKTASGDTATRTSEYEIVNGGFEAGNLSGWQVAEGLAFSEEGVNSNPCWWAEQIPYERDGEYHYGYYNPTATGRMRSSEFTVGGSGYITYKLGGCADNNATYLRFMKVVENGDDEEILKVSNFAFKDMQFPNVQNGLRLLNLVQYRLNLSAYMGARLYIEAVDENSSDNMAGCMVLDSFITYHENVPEFTHWYDVELSNEEVLPDNEYQIKNGGFETGDLTGWTLDGNLGVVSADDTWWAERLPFNKSGKYFFNGLSNEGGTGTLTSSLFTVGGAGWMTFKLGGAHDPRFCYISLLDENGAELERYGNHLFIDAKLENVNKGTNLANMVSYRVNLSKYTGRKLRIQIVDRADSNWGLVTADSFVTYYENTEVSRFPANSVEAVNILTYAGNLAPSEYQIANGNFETGDLSGWELNGDIGGISYDYMWWKEWYTYNKSGLYLFSGFGKEGNVGTLTSSAFKVGGANTITYRLGGGMDSSLCYIEVVDAENPDKIYYRFGNEKFSTKGGVYIGYPITVGCYGFGANMVLYKADLSGIAGKTVKLRITDNAVKDWGLLTADDFVTYYANAESVPADAAKATDILPVPEYDDITRTLNLAYGENSVVLSPKNANAIYEYEYKLAEENAEVTLDGNRVIISPADEMNLQFNKTYSITVIVNIKNVYSDVEPVERTVNLTLTAIYDNRRILNGGFETGDLTGWTVSSGNIKTDGAVVSAETFWGENIAYNQSGNYHFDGWGAQYAEADLYSLKSSAFTLSGSGFISFKMGGASAVIKVYKADGQQIAEYDNTEFANIEEVFPHIDEGSRLATMTTFVADLSSYLGEELYIEICDGKDVGWGVAFFDEIVTYYETAPDVSASSDTVRLNALTSSTGEECDFKLKWVTAVNKI